MVFLLPTYHFLTFIMSQSMGSSTAYPPMFNFELCGRPVYTELCKLWETDNVKFGPLRKNHGFYSFVYLHPNSR